MSNYNILYIVSCLDRGGLELRLLNFSRKFPENYKLHICVTSDRLDLLEKFQATNAKIIVVPIIRAYFEIFSILKICLYVKNNNIGIINSFDFKGLLIGIFVKFFSRSRISNIHNTVDLLHSYSRRHKFILRWLFLFVDKCVCLLSSIE